MDCNQKLQALRREMEKENIDMFLINSEDAYMAVSGVMHSYWRGMKWLTGFAGSLGYALVTEDTFAFWTDSRFTAQAENEIRIDGVKIYNITEQPTHYLEWMIKKLGKKSGTSLRLAVDGRTISTERGRQISEYLLRVKGKDTQFIADLDLIGRIWTDRPAPEFKPIFEHELKYAGRSRKEKLSAVRDEMRRHGADYYILGGVEGIAWLTNMRGREGSTGNPLFAAHAVVTPDCLQLFCKCEMIPQILQEQLRNDGFQLYDIAKITEKLREIPAGSIIYMDPYRTNYLMRYSLPDSCSVIMDRDIVNDLKAVKNEIEIENLRKTNLIESVALLRTFRYVKENAGKIQMTENDVHDVLENYRKRNREYLYENAIQLACAYMENAAWPEYRPTEDRPGAKIEARGIVLIDALSHYLGGSVDMCRTIYLGPCEYDDELKKEYTIVLQAFMALCRQIIRKGADGACMDSVARCVMWNHHLHYGHGTGHGLGYCNCLHEGPQTFSQRSSKREWAFDWLPLKVGNVMAIEPGVYRENRYGIRIEDNLVIVDDQTNEFGTFFRFDNMFYHPFERELIDVDALHDDELEWLNQYHATTYQKLSPYLEPEEQEYLRKVTAPMYKSAK